MVVSKLAGNNFLNRGIKEKIELYGGFVCFEAWLFKLLHDCVSQNRDTFTSSVQDMISSLRAGYATTTILLTYTVLCLVVA